MIAFHMETALTELGHLVQTARSVAEAEVALSQGDIDLAVLDFHLSDGTSSELVVRLQALGVPFVVCSGSVSLYELGEEFRNTRFLPKPFTTDGLIEAVMAAGGDECHVQ